VILGSVSWKVIKGFPKKAVRISDSDTAEQAGNQRGDIMNKNLVEIDGFVEAQEKNLVDVADSNPFSGYTPDSWISCWVCNSNNTRMVYSRGYGIVLECVDCRERFPEFSVIQWSF
jgi:hypothetical protein